MWYAFLRRCITNKRTNDEDEQHRRENCKLPVCLQQQLPTVGMRGTHCHMQYFGIRVETQYKWFIYYLCTCTWRVRCLHHRRLLFCAANSMCRYADVLPRWFDSDSDRGTVARWRGTKWVVIPLGHTVHNQRTKLMTSIPPKPNGQTDSI